MPPSSPLSSVPSALGEEPVTPAKPRAGRRGAKAARGNASQRPGRKAKTINGTTKAKPKCPAKQSEDPVVQSTTTQTVDDEAVENVAKPSDRIAKAQSADLDGETDLAKPKRNTNASSQTLETGKPKVRPDDLKVDTTGTALAQKPTIDSPAQPPKTPEEQQPDPEPKTRTSGRKRTAPERLEDVQPVTPARKAPKLTNGEKTAAPLRSSWDATQLMTSKKSMLGRPQINLKALLLNQKAWTALTREQQLELIKMLPNTDVNALADREDLPPIPQQMLRDRPAMQTDLRFFKEHLVAGHYNPEWLRQAQEASDARMRGDFDTWKEEEREEYWGQKADPPA